MSRSAVRNGSGSVKGSGGILLPLVLAIISLPAIAVPQHQGSTSGVTVVVTRFDEEYPDKNSPTNRLLEWLDKTLSDQYAVEVEYLETTDSYSVIEFLRNLPAGSFIVLHGNADVTDTLLWSIRCETVVNGEYPGGDAPAERFAYRFQQDPEVLRSDAVPDMISFLSHSALAMVYLQRNETTVAGQELTLSLACTEGVSGDLAAMNESLRQELLAASDPLAGVRTITDEIQTGPATAELYMERARANALAGEYEASVSDLETAIGMGPSTDSSYPVFANSIIEILTLMRRAYNAGEDIDTALFDTVEGSLVDAAAYLDTAISLEPDSAGLYMARASVHGFLIEWTPAMEDLSSAIELEPDNCTAWALRGAVRLEMGFPEEAVEDLSRAIEISPDSARYYDWRGFAYQMMGEEDKAEADMSTAAELQSGEE